MASNRPESGDFADLRARYEACGQGHVFRFWPRLDAAERDRLRVQAEGIDLEGALSGLEACLARAGSPPPELAPVELIALPERGGDPQARKEAEAAGEAALAAGRVGVMVVAGGQASRLGFSGPKGSFPIGPVSSRSLFALQAQKLQWLRQRYGRAIPWYVMTSPATDSATRSFFQINGDFDLPDQDVFFFRQAMVPSFDFDRKLMLDRRDHIFENPDGHGGSLTALERSGALDDMQERGIDTLFYYQVDNPLVSMADPVFLGFHLLRDSEISCKVIRKQDPEEKVGVVALVDGRVGVVEYTEIDETARNLRDADGELVYAAGNTAIHAFDTGFVRRVAAGAPKLLPFHASAKRIPSVDDSGRVVQPDAPNGHKLERFVFDALGASERVTVVEADRRREYSPVKNAEGRDSPATARRDLSACYREWMSEAGIALPDPRELIEIDQAQVGGAEDLRALGIRSASEAGGVIRIAAGEPT